MNYGINDNENQMENENEANQEQLEFFKVSPEGYTTESDSNTIIDFDDEEDINSENQIEEQNHSQNQDNENHDEYISNEGQENQESNAQKSHDHNQEEGEEEEHHENQNEDNAEPAENPENHEGEEEHQNNGEEEEHEHENEHEQEQENQEENEEEENGITDPNVKQLMKMDLADKDGIIDLLMKDDLVKKSDVKNEKIIKEKNKAKFDYVESTIGKKPIGNKKSTYGRQGFQIVPEEGNPEFIKDMNIAAYAVKDQIEEENLDVAKILFEESGAKKINKRITREQIDEKVKKTLEKKKKNLEKIEAQMYEQQKYEETFAPAINHRKGENKERRNLNKFLTDQNNFSKRVQKKREDLLNKKEEKRVKENVGKPQVDKNSEELAKKLNNTDQPAYMRLYNKRTVGQEKIAEMEKLKKENKKKDEMKRKEKLNENKKLYGHIQSKIDMGQKKVEPVYDEFGNIQNIKNRENKEKQEKELEKARILQRKMKKKKGKLLEVKDIPTNKMLLNNFEKKFDEEIQAFPNENLTETDFHNLLFNLGMVSYPPKKEENKKEDNNEEQNEEEENDEEKHEEKINPEINIENPIKQEEKKLISESINCLKNDQNELSKEDIKNFLICVLGNQKYEFYRRYKNQHENELKDIFPPAKCKKEDIPDLIIKKQNEEILTKVDKNNEKNSKYAYKTNDGKLYFSLEKGHAIKKDFSMFALNYRNNKKPSKDVNKLLKDKKVYNFKPAINENSEKLYQKYKDKVASSQSKTIPNNPQTKDSHMDYIERILLHDKKRIAETQKVKEELEKKELKECTFKPKINEDYMIKKVKTIEKAGQNNDNNAEKKNRMIELYEKGTADIKKKKNKTKEEMEVESQIKECTFHPKINKDEEKMPETKFSNDIYKEKEYKDLYERLRKGRMERLVKANAVERFGLDNDLKKFVKQNKLNKNKDYVEEEKAQDELGENNNSKNNKNNKNEKNDSGYKSKSINKNEEENYNNSLEQSSEDEGEKKEGIPLLIIDVNIRQGVKKKIYVYEGDTPEGLAEKFAKEHNLEEETKNKLQNLIHNHMLRLLTRIEEENQSISEKSQTTHNNKK